MADTIKASEFKARCLQLMDRVARDGEPIVITKNGTPVAQLGPVSTRRATTLIGLHRAELRLASEAELTAPMDVVWEADVADP